MNGDSAVRDSEERGLSRIPAVPAARFLEHVLAFTFVAHGLGMLSMILFLLPGLPGGHAASDAARIAYIGMHPWLWRLGWLPWQITALSDILLATALLRTPWVPRLPAMVTLVLTCAAVVPDQIGQVRWITEGVRLAAEAARTHNPADYLKFEAETYRAVAALAATLYTLGALGWTWCFVAAETWSRRLTWLSIPLWTIFLFASVGPLLPVAMRPSALAVGIGNALGFLLLLWWLLEVLEQVLRRSRPDSIQGRFMVWQSPRADALSVLTERIANSRTATHLCSYLPCLPFDSDITDVLYVNYLVPAARLTPLVPSGLVLRRLGPGGEYALFTVLTFRHGRFGPRMLRGLPLWLPSPIQSNWRIHVVDPNTGSQGICFVINAASSTTVALGARLMLRAMPIHPLASAKLTRYANDCLRLTLDPGCGSGPDMEATLCPTGDRTLPHPWNLCFTDYRTMLAYCVPQNRAMASQPWFQRNTRQEIRLDIPLTDCNPLSGEVHSRLAEEIGGGSAALCFHVARVAFRFDRQEFDAWPIGDR